MENYKTIKHMKDWSSINAYKLSRTKYEQDEKSFTTSFKNTHNMIYQAKDELINSLVYQITEKHLHTDVFNNIMQYLDNNVPVLYIIQFNKTNI